MPLASIQTAGQNNGIHSDSPLPADIQEVVKDLLPSPALELIRTTAVKPNWAPQETNQKVLQHYDICMCLYGTNGKIYSEWEALTTFLLKLQGIDDSIQIHPWKVRDQHSRNPPILLSSLPQAFFNLQTYVPQLAGTSTSWTTQAELG